MNNRGVLVFLVSAFFILIFCAVFLFAFFDNSRNLQNSKNSSHFNYENGSISCYSDEDCNDGSSCTLDYCGDEGFCVNTKVVLCYQNDGCCPKGCTPQNDNDCSN